MNNPYEYIKETVLESVSLVDARLKTIADEVIRQVVKDLLVPLNTDRTSYLEKQIEDLKKQISVYESTFAVLNSSLLGWIALNRLQKKLKKQELLIKNSEIKDEQKNIKEN